MRKAQKGAALVVAIGCVLTVCAQPVRAQLPADPTPQQQQTVSEKQLEHGANSFAESQAHDLLVQQGYSNISPLMNKDGIWRGKAVKGDKTFDVSIDYLGQIAAK